HRRRFEQKPRRAFRPSRLSKGAAVRFRNLTSLTAGRWGVRRGEELVQCREQLAGLFNVRNVSAVVQQNELRAHGLRALYGRRRWNRIVTTPNDEHREVHWRQATKKIVVRPDAVPHALLNPSDHAKWGEISRFRRVGEVTRHSKLKSPLLVPSRIFLA